MRICWFWTLRILIWRALVIVQTLGNFPSVYKRATTSSDSKLELPMAWVLFLSRSLSLCTCAYPCAWSFLGYLRHGTTIKIAKSGKTQRVAPLQLWSKPWSQWKRRILCQDKTRWGYQWMWSYSKEQATKRRKPLQTFQTAITSWFCSQFFLETVKHLQTHREVPPAAWFGSGHFGSSSVPWLLGDADEPWKLDITYILLNYDCKWYLMHLNASHGSRTFFTKAVLATGLSLARQDSPFGDRSLGGDFSRSKARADTFSHWNTCRP